MNLYYLCGLNRTPIPIKKRTIKFNQGENMIATPPANLKPAGKKLWIQIASEFVISDAAGQRLLQSACEAADLIADAEAVIARDGLTIPDRYGAIRAHPLLATIRGAQGNLVRALRSLNLDEEVVPAGNVGRRAHS